MVEKLLEHFLDQEINGVMTAPVRFFIRGLEKRSNEVGLLELDFPNDARFFIHYNQYFYE